MPPSVNDGRITAGKADLGLDLQRLLHRVRERRARAGEADPRHRLLEFLAVLGLVDRLAATRRSSRRRNFSSTPFAREVERAVERRLAAHGRQQRVRALARDDARRPSAR